MENEKVVSAQKCSEEISTNNMLEEVPKKKKDDTNAIISMILGLVGCFLMQEIVMKLICGIVAIVLAKKDKENSESGSSMGTVGKVFGIIDVSLSGVAVITSILAVIGYIIFYVVMFVILEKTGSL